MANIIRRATNKLSVGIERYMPHSFIFAVVLTAIAYAAALVGTPAGPYEVVDAWYGEFWSFLTFAMQMTLIVVTGYGIASAPVTKSLLRRISRLPSSSTQAYLSVVVVAAGLAYVNWGLGLVGGAFYAITVGAYRDDIDFGFLVAIAYIGVWSGVVGSVSVTAPLLVNTPEHFLEDQIGLIPLTETIFSPMHLTIVLGTLLMSLVLVYVMRPPAEDVEPLAEDRYTDLVPDYSQAGREDGEPYLATRLNGNPIFSLIVVLLGGTMIVSIFAFEGIIAALNINSMNLILLVVGLALHGRPISYVRAVTDGVERASQVILQFPFYAGIQGILIGTGLATLIVDWFVNIASASTFPVLTFLVTGVLNVFVPSAGGQYIVMGEILHSAGATLGVSDPLIVSAYTVGDGWTNMLQPFWALPVIGIAGLQVRHIWGYVMMGMIMFGLTAGAILLAFPLLGLV